MGREMAEGEMKELVGCIPAVLDRVPDELVDADWRLFRNPFVDDSLIPGRYKALIGVAVAAAIRCSSTARLHAELARAHGASEAELAEAVHHAALALSWSTRIHGFQLEPGELEAEAADIGGHVAGRLSID
ncbi:MAG: carboxymuconolactone decarboxylase family protein [Acidimicrobiia bacterium]